MRKHVAKRPLTRALSMRTTMLWSILLRQILPSSTHGRLFRSSHISTGSHFAVDLLKNPTIFMLCTIIFA
jgi:hypothetical protein